MGSTTTVKSELLAIGLLTTGLLSIALPLIFIDMSCLRVVIIGVDLVIIGI